jgi:hypothetical protein
MKKIYKATIKYQFIVILLFTQFVQAQPGFESDDVEDVPAAPIDNWLIPMFVVGVVLVYYIYRRQLTVTPR